MEELEDSHKIYKFTPKNAETGKYGVYFHGGGYFAEVLNP